MTHELLYRRNAVRECLRAQRRKIHRLQVARDADLADAQDILAEAKRRGLPIETVDRKHINLATHGERHQNLILEVGPYPYADFDDVLIQAAQRGEPPLVLVLDLVQDPRNVGALLRTAEAMGVHGVVIQERRGCEVTPTVVNTAAGATEHLRIAQVTNLADAMRRLKQRDVWLAGLDLSADAQPLDRFDRFPSVHPNGRARPVAECGRGRLTGVVCGPGSPAPTSRLRPTAWPELLAQNRSAATIRGLCST